MWSKKQIQESRAETLFRAANVFEELEMFRDAFKCHLIAAELNHKFSQLNLGSYYASGRGVRKNLKLAESWSKRAYKNGVGAAAHNLALEKRGEGDIKAAIGWLKKAIAKQEAAAYVELADIYAGKKPSDAK